MIFNETRFHTSQTLKNLRHLMTMTGQTPIGHCDHYSHFRCCNYAGAFGKLAGTDTGLNLWSPDDPDFGLLYGTR